MGELHCVGLTVVKLGKEKPLQWAGSKLMLCSTGKGVAPGRRGDKTEEETHPWKQQQQTPSPPVPVLTSSTAITTCYKLAIPQSSWGGLKPTLQMHKTNGKTKENRDHSTSMSNYTADLKHPTK